MGTPVANFAKATVSTGYNSAATSIALSTGHGSRLPSTFPYPLVWWNATDYPDPADDPNREIVTVTNRVSDTLTITRASEGTVATNKNTAGKTYKMIETITKAMWQELQARALTQSHRGLRVMTNPNNDARKSKVLVNADAIVMDDGQEVASWSNLVADITASGANGLDAGTEQASTWYEIWALYNGSTKAVMLHRAKDYLLDQDTSGLADNTSYALRDATARTKQGQGFRVAVAGPVEFVDVKLIKTGAPTGNFWFTIESDSGGVPNNTPLATSDKYDVSRLITTSEWVRIPFRTPASLSAATQYHLVLQGDFTVSGANFMSWRGISTGGVPNGSQMTYDGATWTAVVGVDLMYKIYVTENDTAVTLPTGYMQKAFLGYVYNDSGSDFRPFHQIGRRVFCGETTEWRITNSFAVTTPTLIDARAYLPPRTVAAQFTYANTGSAHFVIGDIRATDFTTANANVPFIGIVRGVTANVGWEETPAPIVLDPYCGFVLAHNAGTGTLYLTGFEF